MQPGELAYIATSDLAGICRGRAVPLADLPRWSRSGCSWVPASLAITPFGEIPEPNAFGPLGDLRLVPDAASAARVALGDGTTPYTLLLGDLLQTTGAPWLLCPRGLLRQAITDLAATTGLTVRAAFEHEFSIRNPSGDTPPALSIRALQQAEPFGSHLLQVLAAADLEPETFHSEFGAGQWEVTVAPADPLTAADRAITLREVVRDLGTHHDKAVTFSPITDPGQVGNGVHIHLSLIRPDGSSAMPDPTEPGTLGPDAAAFTAGILRHSTALTAITAASSISAQRFAPHKWAATHAFLGHRNREASLRLCPPCITNDEPVTELNIEYRAADATANPWLALWALIRAGLAGIDDRLAPPPVLAQSIDNLSPDLRTSLGITPLPASLAEQLAALQADRTVTGWFPPELLATYLLVKNSELSYANSASLEQQITHYATTY